MTCAPRGWRAEGGYQPPKQNEPGPPPPYSAQPCQPICPLGTMPVPACAQQVYSTPCPPGTIPVPMDTYAPYYCAPTLPLQEMREPRYPYFPQGPSPPTPLEKKVCYCVQLPLKQRDPPNPPPAPPPPPPPTPKRIPKGDQCIGPNRPKPPPVPPPPRPSKTRKHDCGCPDCEQKAQRAAAGMKKKKDSKPTTEVAPSSASDITSSPPSLRPGVNYMFPKEHTYVHIFNKSAEVWVDKYKGQVLTFKVFKVSTLFNVRFIISQVVKTDDAAILAKWAVTEVIELGNGEWEKGTTIEFKSDDAGRTLADIGWNKERGRKLPPTWLVVHKIGFCKR